MDVEYKLTGGVAHIAMDDGKANAMSPKMIDQMNSAFDAAENDQAVVVLSGRDRLFCGGFDLSVFEQGPRALLEMLIGGAELLERMLGFETPIVVACGGHAPAMGSFMLLASDYRIGAQGRFKIGFNEVKIGLPLPRFAVEVARQRLSPVAFNQTLLARMYRPDEAMVAGFLDEVVEADQVLETAMERAEEFSKLNLAARKASIPTVRGAALKAIRAAIDDDLISELNKLD